ncbi:MAG TPA: VWA domain-containing protein [Candidatus Desulfaltia sp.]|nr:VWA domain-containing protein [Candidatus Desulfaltia sp.]
MKSILLSTAASILISGALSVSGRPVYPQQNPQEKTEIRHEVTVTLKLVQVFVVDKKGNPVLDLGKDDFHIFDNGKEQVITEFEKHTLKFPSPGAVELPVSLEETPLLPPRHLMPRKFFLFFDFAHNSPKGLIKAKEAALHFIDSHLLPTDEVGILSYSGLENLELWEYLTADHKKVREVVESFGLKKLSGRVDNLQEKYYEAVTGQNPVDIEAWGRATLRGPEKRLPDMGAKPDLDRSLELKSLKFAERGELHAVMFADRIKELAMALRYISGQKNIVLFSSGVPYSLIYGIQAPYGDVRFGDFGNSLLKQRYEDMLHELTASNCLIYALDTEDAGASLKKEIRTMGVFTLQKMTSATGGKYFGNINRYEEHIEKIQNLTGCYYVLGYAIDEKWDGAFHTIKVEIARPECEVHAQKGYYNPKLFKEYNELEKMLHLVDLALNEEPVFQTPVSLAVVRRPCPPDKTSNLCLSAELPLDKIREVLQGKYEIVSIVFDENGNTVELKREEESSAEFLKNRDTYEADFKLAPGIYECRVIIRNLETGSGAVGGVSVAVENGQKPH